jgi:nucleoside-diphosphate-sugar epimerase
MRVLLTGTTGFIGSAVARELLRLGHEVHATLRPSSDRRRIAGLAGLILHEAPMDAVPVEPDLAIHLAWYTVPGKYLSAPENRECLEASRRLLAKLDCRVVAAGTCFEYDMKVGLRTEESPLGLISLYTECKDALRRELASRPDAAWVRIFYQYGPREDERRQVPKLILALLRGEPVDLPPCRARRDYLHVEDVASAVCATAFSRLQGAVNVGSGEAPELAELMSIVGRAAGRPELVRLGALPAPADEPPLIQADVRKLRTTGWSPRWSLEAGLRQTVEWWRGELR